MAACAASRSGKRCAASARIASSCSAGTDAPGTSSAAVRRQARLPRATVRANSRAASRRFLPGGTIESSRPASRAACAFMGSASATMRHAARTPTSRGRRCVPPAPGTKPRLTSGKASWASCAPMRAWQAMASSTPPPMALPCSAMATGLEKFSTRAARSPSEIPCGSGGWPSSRRSPPPENVSPPAAMTTHDTRASVCRSSSASHRPRRTVPEIALTGGLWMVSIATPSSTAHVRGGV